MRGLIILWLLVSFTNCAKAQLTEDEKAIINLVTQPSPEKPDFCSYDANFPAWLVQQVDLYFKTDTTVHLSANEKKELISKMQAAEQAPKWNQSNTNHIKLYTINTNPKDFVDTLYYDSVKKKFSNLSIFYFLEFSKPIFIRNNSMCFIYRHILQTCLYDALSRLQECPQRDMINLYVKENGAWIYKKWIFMSIGD
jgi:hypothetical protein